MRIVHLIEATLAGVGRHVLDLAAWQAGQGHEVSLIHADRRMDAIFREEMAALPLQDRLVVDVGSGPSLADVSAVRAIRGFLRDKGPFDVIHGHSSKGGALARLAAGPRDGLRVYTPNAVKTLDPTVGSAGRLVYGQIESFLGKQRTDLLVAVSSEERTHVTEVLGVPADRVELVFNGTDARPRSTRAAQRQAFGLAETDICALFVGRMNGQKAPQKLVAAAVAMADDWPENLRIVMLGDGPLLEGCRQAVAAAGLEGRVILPGAGRGVDAMLAADFYIMTSDYEGFPYVLIEALQSGLPVVTTRVGGCYDLVLQDKTGLVVENWAPRDIAAAIRTVASDAALRQLWSAAAREHAAAFTTAAMGAATQAAYEKHIARKRGAVAR